MFSGWNILQKIPSMGEPSVYRPFNEIRLLERVVADSVLKGFLLKKVTPGMFRVKTTEYIVQS